MATIYRYVILKGVTEEVCFTSPLLSVRLILSEQEGSRMLDPLWQAYRLASVGIRLAMSPLGQGDEHSETEARL
jgi:hypothetical protein